MFKKITAAVATLAIICGLIFAGSMTADTDVKAAANVASNVYRAYNAKTGDHILTPSLSEYNSLVNRGLRGEGAVFYANGRGNDVYRLYNSNNGEHFYTANLNEMNGLIRRGWQYEGVCFTTSGSTRVFRLCNPKTGRHVFTTSESERDYLWLAGWRYEGVAFYCSGPATGSTPTTTPSTPTVNNNTQNYNPNNYYSSYGPNTNTNQNNNNANTGTPSGTTNVANPVAQRSSLSDINSYARTRIARPSLYSAVNERFYTINSSPSPIAQYNFDANGFSYSLRGAAYTSADISGYFISGTGTPNYTTGADGIQYYQDSAVKLARWVAFDGCQYVLNCNDNGWLTTDSFAALAQNLRANTNSGF